LTTIGILGGGQLGYMLALAGYPLGLHFRFLDPSPEAPVGRIAHRVTAEFMDEQALEKFAHGLEVVTYEFENVPVEAARFLAERVAVYPPAAALEAAQDRLREKRLFQKLGILTTEFAEVHGRADFDAAVREIGLPAILKTCRMGYDGKGQSLLRTKEDVENARLELPEVPLVLEKYVPFTRELSILGARGRTGEIVFYPVIENHHRGGILRLSLAPAPNLTAGVQQAAEEAGRKVLEELAPRVHNSGHWSIEGAVTSQFENHLRAVMGMPLGLTTAMGYSAMVNLIAELPEAEEVLAVSNTHLHLYGKSPRPGRKLGHATVRAEKLEKLQQRLSELPAFFKRPEYCLEEALPETLAKRA
jgi:5-(carboxyamino)imidazole ribonucleotide synthase